jgi:hypothetical protein
MRTLTLLLLASAAAYSQPDPNAEEQKKIFADVTANALQYSKNMPDFMCRQVTRRNVDQTGTGQRWKQLDTVNEELTISGGKENYRVIAVNGKAADNLTHDRLGNLTSASDFANILQYIFDPKSKTEFNWTQWDSLRGHRVHVIGFKVTQENSQYVVAKSKGHQVTASIFGLIYADAETGSVLRITFVAGDIPAKFPVQGVTLDLNYEFTKVGDQISLLPMKGDIHSKEGKTMIWNEVEFRDFRKPK